MLEKGNIYYNSPAIAQYYLHKKRGLECVDRCHFSPNQLVSCYQKYKFADMSKINS